MRGSHDLVLCIGRVLLCLLFITAGFDKLFIIDAFAANMAGKGMPVPWLFPIMAIVIELGGGLVLALGIETRILAVLFAIYVVVASLISHPFWTMTDPARAANEIHFYKNVAIIGGFVLLAATGGGRFSVDALGLLPWRAGSRRSQAGQY